MVLLNGLPDDIGRCCRRPAAVVIPEWSDVRCSRRRDAAGFLSHTVDTSHQGNAVWGPPIMVRRAGLRIKALTAPSRDPELDDFCSTAGNGSCHYLV